MSSVGDFSSAFQAPFESPEEQAGQLGMLMGGYLAPAMNFISTRLGKTTGAPTAPTSTLGSETPPEAIGRTTSLEPTGEPPGPMFPFSALRRRSSGSSLLGTGSSLSTRFGAG